MIDTDEYEELLENGMQHRDLWELASELLAEVKWLRKLLAEADERARLAIESHPNADEMLEELIR